MKASRAFHFENPFGRKPGAALLVLAALLWLGPSPVVAKGHSAQGTPPKDPAFGAFLPIPLQMASLGIQSLDGKKAEDFVLPTLDGKTLRLSDFRGKVVFLNFWASWCPACRIEMPDMEALHRRFKGRDFAVLSVAVDT
ncbi:MAG: TlpA disulfide reductase family protein, partial [Nitrospinota bacterium]